MKTSTYYIEQKLLPKYRFHRSVSKISGPVDFPTTTDYHWSKFDVNASQKNGKHEVVQGPFQFGLADKLDKNDKEVIVCKLLL